MLIGSGPIAGAPISGDFRFSAATIAGAVARLYYELIAGRQRHV